MNSWQQPKVISLAADPLYNRHAMWRAIDEANERWERESWEATLADIKALQEVPR